MLYENKGYYMQVLMLIEVIHVYLMVIQWLFRGSYLLLEVFDNPY